MLAPRSGWSTYIDGDLKPSPELAIADSRASVRSTHTTGRGVQVARR
jgi:hypothetical protein